MKYPTDPNFTKTVMSQIALKNQRFYFIWERERA